MLDEIKCLDTEETIDQAMDVLFDWIDDLLIEERFEEVGEILSSMRIREYSLNILIGMLSITYCAKALIGSPRSSFYDRVFVKILTTEGADRIPGLLGGLE